MAEDAKTQLYNLAFHQGLLTEEQHQDCVRTQQALDNAGRHSSLLSIAVHRGYVTREQIADIQKVATGQFQQLTPSSGMPAQAGPAEQPQDTQTKHQHASPPQDTKHLIDGYEISDSLGKGGFGIVYLATQLSLNRPVAIKILPPELSSNELYVQRFFREAQTAGKLVHPNVVQVLDVGQSNGYYYIVMEYVEGEALEKVIKTSGPLPEEQVLSIGSSIGKALQAAMKFSLVHRDIKPGNLLLTNEGLVKLADFGIARQSDDTSVTQDSRIIGTPDYMSPEQSQGKPVDVRSDIYSLGATLYHCVTGRPPFQGDTATGVMLQHVQDPPVPPRDRNPMVSEGLNQVILRMMEKRPDQRFQTPDGVVTALANVEAAPVATANAGDDEEQYLTVDSDPIPEAIPSDEEFFEDEEGGGFENILKIGVAGLVGAAVVSVVMVVLSRQPSPPPEPVVPVQQQVVVEVDQNLPPEQPSAVQKEWSTELQAERQQIDAFLAANPTEISTALEQFKAFADMAWGSGLDTAAMAKANELKMQVEKQAEETLQYAQRAAAVLVKNGKFGAAIAEYQKIRSGGLNDKMVDQVEQEIQNITSQADAAWKKEEGKATGLAIDGNLEQAIDLLEKLKSTGISSLDRAQKKLLTKLRRDLAAKNDQLFAAAREKLKNVQRTADLHARRLKFDLAVRTMKDALLDNEMKLLSEEINQKAEEFQAMDRVSLAVLEGATRSVGQTFKVGGVNGTIKGVKDGKVMIAAGVAEMAFDPVRLSTTQFVGLADRALSDVEGEDQIAVGLFLMMKKDFAGAKARFERASQLGEDVSRYVRRLEQEGGVVAEVESKAPKPGSAPKKKTDVKVTVDDVFAGKAVKKSTGTVQISYTFSTDAQLDDFNSPFKRQGGQLIARSGSSYTMTHIAPFERQVAINLQLSNSDGARIVVGATSTGGYSSTRSQTFYCYYRDRNDYFYGYLYPFGGSGRYPFSGRIDSWSRRATTFEYQRNNGRVDVKVNRKSLYSGSDPVGAADFAGHISISNNGRDMNIESLAIVGRIDSKWLKQRLDEAKADKEAAQE